MSPPPWRVAFALAATLAAPGCRRGAPSPSAVVRAYIEAAREGHVDRILPHLGPRTRARLEADARRAAEASRRPITPADLLAVGWTAPRYEVVRLRELAAQGDRVVVQVEGAGGVQERLEMVREGGLWKLELP